MTDLSIEWIKDALDRLAAAKAPVFGAEAHGFRLNPPLDEADLRSFETRHDIRLPPDYRWFLARVGNGGAGPCYGLFPLGKWDGRGDGLEVWNAGESFWGLLAKPFPHVEAWNDTSGIPSDELVDSAPDEYERLLGEFETRYWEPSIVNGAMPICHEGCAHRVLLVITGAEAGHLWYDSRASDAGLGPLAGPDGSRVTFSSWYRAWLEEALASLPTRDVSAPRRLWQRLTRRH